MRNDKLMFVPIIAAPPGVDPLESLLREIDRGVHTNGWDAPNIYHMILGYHSGLIASKIPPRLADLLGPLYAVDALQALAEGFARNLRHVPADFLGWVCTHEAWGITTNIHDQAATVRAIEDAMARRTHQREDRVEVRQSLVVLINGREGLLTHQRGTDGVPDSYMYLPSGASGVIVDALRKLVGVCSAAVA